MIYCKTIHYSPEITIPLSPSKLLTNPTQTQTCFLILNILHKFNHMIYCLSFTRLFHFYNIFMVYTCCQIRCCFLLPKYMTFYGYIALFIPSLVDRYLGISTLSGT